MENCHSANKPSTKQRQQHFYNGLLVIEVLLSLFYGRFGGGMTVFYYSTNQYVKHIHSITLKELPKLLTNTHNTYTKLIIFLPTFPIISSNESASTYFQNHLSSRIAYQIPYKFDIYCPLSLAYYPLTLLIV